MAKTTKAPKTAKTGNNMSNFEYLEWILSHKFLCTEPDHHTMREEKGTEHKKHEVKVCFLESEVSNFALYRYDLDEFDFLPFLRKGTGSAKGCCSFCDYIILAEKNGALTIILVEMKRGDAYKAPNQLEASQLFIDYILNIAERVKDDNNMPDFDRHDISILKVTLLRNISNKLITKPKNVNSIKNDVIIKYQAGTEFWITGLL